MPAIYDKIGTIRVSFTSPNFLVTYINNNAAYRVRCFYNQSDDYLTSGTQVSISANTVTFAVNEIGTTNYFYSALLQMRDSKGYYRFISNTGAIREGIIAANYTEFYLFFTYYIDDTYTIRLANGATEPIDIYEVGIKTTINPNLSLPFEVFQNETTFDILPKYPTPATITVNTNRTQPPVITNT